MSDLDPRGGGRTEKSSGEEDEGSDDSEELGEVDLLWLEESDCEGQLREPPLRTEPRLLTARYATLVVFPLRLEGNGSRRNGSRSWMPLLVDEDPRVGSNPSK